MAEPTRSTGREVEEPSEEGCLGEGTKMTASAVSSEVVATSLKDGEDVPFVLEGMVLLDGRGLDAACAVERIGKTSGLHEVLGVSQINSGVLFMLLGGGLDMLDA